MTCLSSVSVHCLCIVIEGGDVEVQLRLRQQTINCLKQEMASLREEKESIIFTLEERIKELTYEVQEHKRQLLLAPIKEEGTANGSFVCPFIHLSLCQLIVEKKPVALLPVKIELKEEAVTMTKAETMSAQPTTGMSSHSITAIVCEASYMSTATWNLRGADVCGEMSVEIYSSHAQQITWEDFGLKLHIQEGSLPAVHTPNQGLSNWPV